MTDREHDWTPIPDSEVGYDAGTFRAFRCRYCGLGLERDSARSLPDGPCEPPDREREARTRERGTTHWQGCWRSHPRCAEARVEKLEARVERYREALPLLDFIREADEAGFWWQIGGPGHYTDEGLGPQRDCVTIAASPHGRYFDPGNGGFIARGETLAEAADRAHRALNEGEDDG